MSETKRTRPRPFNRHRLQQGATIIEFAFIAIVFFTFVFGVIELARLMYLFNTLPEVTRRAASAAANTDFTNAAQVALVRQRAIFRDAAGSLVLMDELTDQSIRIDYMAVERNSDGTLKMVQIPTGSLPSSPYANRQVCLSDPNSPTCIRLVRVRVCDPGDPAECVPMQFHSIIPLFDLSVPLPISTTLAKARSLGLM